jgi:two-component system KDP operon response regulator KdpE
MIVDDEAASCRSLRVALIARGFEISDARTGDETLERLKATAPHVVLLRLAVPGMSGLETCFDIRSSSTVPIIFMSECPLESQKVKAFEAGGDDYVVKPFGIEELVARIRALIRRTGVLRRHTISLGNVQVDLESHDVKRGDTVEHLTSKEFKLLYCLISHGGEIVSHCRLLQAVWGPDYGNELAYLRVFINQLRKKVEPDPARPQHILTEPCEGYRFVERPEVHLARGPAVLREIAYASRSHRGAPRGRAVLTPVVKKVVMSH